MIHLTGISKQHGPKVLYQNGSLQLNPGDKVGLVGPNGAGKTTIFRVIMRQEGVDSGQVNISKELVIGYFSQDVGEMKGRSAIEEVMAGGGRVYDLSLESHKLEKKLAESLSEDEMQKVLERYGDLQTEFERLGGYGLEARAKEILAGLGISNEESEKPVEAFSGGWKMRIALAKILFLNPDVLLLDEPTNHLDLESIVWLEEFLKNYKGTIFMTSHDRDFMNRLVSRIVEVAHKTITSYSGNYDYYEKQRELKLQQLLAEAKKQEAMLERSERFIERFSAHAAKAAQVQSRVKQLEKIDRVEIPQEEASINFEFPKPGRSGNEVVKFEKLTKSYGDKLVFKNATGLVQRGDRIAVVGVNGAGKSSLLKIIAGHTEVTGGSCVIGQAVDIAYFSQHSLDVLDARSNPFEQVQSRVPQGSIGFIRSLLGAFLFSNDDVYKKISVLSGGEKSRVVLATMMAKPANLLILDEPTNHLDIKSREMLLKALKEFQGTVLLVSHDRHFLREVSTKVFELDRGQLIPYDGGYEYYTWKKQQTGLS